MFFLLNCEGPPSTANFKKNIIIAAVQAVGVDHLAFSSRKPATEGVSKPAKILNHHF